MSDLEEKLSKGAHIFFGVVFNIIAAVMVFAFFAALGGDGSNDGFLDLLGVMALAAPIVAGPVIIGDIIYLTSRLRRNRETETETKAKSWKRLTIIVAVSAFSFIVLLMVVWLGSIFWPGSGERGQNNKSLSSDEAEQLIADCQVSSVRSVGDDIVVELRQDSNHDGEKIHYLPTGVWPSIEKEAKSAREKCEHEIEIVEY